MSDDDLVSIQRRVAAGLGEHGSVRWVIPSETSSKSARYYVADILQ